MSRTESPLQIRTIFYRRATPDYRIDTHTLPCWQWYYVHSGRVRSHLGPEIHHLATGHSTIVTPGLSRDRSCDGEAPCYVVAEFDCNGWQLDRVANRLLTLPTDLAPDADELVQELQAPVGSYSAQLIPALLTRLLIGLDRAHGVPHDSQVRTSPLHASHRRDLVARTEAYLAHNFRNDIQRGDVARALHISESHLARFYRSETGTTLAARIRALRIDHAKRLLRETSLTVTNIAMEVGFDSFSHFSLIFRRATGKSPSDFRRAGRVVR